MKRTLRLLRERLETLRDELYNIIAVQSRTGKVRALQHSDTAYDHICTALCALRDAEKATPEGIPKDPERDIK